MAAETPAYDYDARNAQVLEDVDGEFGVPPHAVCCLGVGRVGTGAVAGEVESYDAVVLRDGGGFEYVAPDFGGGGVSVKEEKGGVVILEGSVGYAY